MPADTKRTGWPPGMLQDDDRRLSRWLASRPGARGQVRELCREIANLIKETKSGGMVDIREAA